jgi:outer membrane protein
MSNLVHRAGLKPSLFVGLSLAVLSSLSLAKPVLAETLNDAIRQAYAQNPTLQRARAQQRANDETFVQARAGLGTSFDAGASVDYNDSLRHDKSSTGLSLSASQVLFASGGLSASLNAAEADVFAGQEDLRSTEARVLLDVIAAYTAVRRDQEALSIGQANF